MKLSEKAIKKVRTVFQKGRHREIGLLMGALNVGERVVIKYIEENSPFLTMAEALRIIQSQTNLTDAELFETEKQTA